MKSSITLSLITLFAIPLFAAPKEPTFKVVKSLEPSQSPIVASFNVMDFGASTKRSFNNAKPFQKALNAAGEIGGGVVYAPSGTYHFSANIVIPEGVTLAGDWKNPKTHPEIIGTVFAVHQSRGDALGTAFISMLSGTGIKNVSFWYPSQDINDITPYPFTVRQIHNSDLSRTSERHTSSINHNVTLENITFVNAYQGFQAGPENNCLHFLHNIYGTPLRLGFYNHFCTDIGRIENLHFAPEYWIHSGLPKAPSEEDEISKLRSWLLDNGVGLHIVRSDWEYVSFVTIRGYDVGMLVSRGEFHGGNAQFYAFHVTECNTAVRFMKTNSIGYAFAHSTLSGIQNGIALNRSFSGPILLHDTVVSGGVHALNADGWGRVAMQNCIITDGDVRVRGGTLSAIDCNFTEPRSQVIIHAEAVAASLIGNQFVGDPKIQIEAPSEQFVVDNRTRKFAPMPRLESAPARDYQPAKSDLFVATDAPFNAVGDAKTDDTAAIQKALDAAAENGGGIVYLPALNYVVKGNLTIPSGVELRGSHAVPFHSRSRGTTLFLFSGKGDADAAPAIAMKERSGARGFLIYYPEQNWNDFFEYPFAIQGQGSDVYTIHVTCINAYNFIDFKTYRCDRHFADYLGGSPLRTGVQVGGGSTDGVIANTQFNPHYWLREDFDEKYQINPPKTDSNKWNNIWKFQKGNLDALVFGDCENQIQFQNFVYGSKYGLLFRTEEGKSSRGGVVIGHGTDGSRIGLYVEAATGEPLSLINSKLVAMDHFEGHVIESHKTTDKKYVWIGEDVEAKVHLFNTMMWGSPNDTGLIEGGHLVMQVAALLQPGMGYRVDGGGFDLINNHMQFSGNLLNIDSVEAPIRLLGSSIADGFKIDGESRPAQEWQSKDGSVQAIANVTTNDVRKGYVRKK